MKEAAPGPSRVALVVSLALVVAACGSSSGNSCQSAPEPPATAELPTGASVDGGVVLPNGRTSFYKHIVRGVQLGHPVDMIANPNPTITVVYVADARYGGGSDDTRCSKDPTTHYRGIHVIDVDGRKELMKPGDLHYPGKVPQKGDPYACSDGTLPYDGAFGLTIRGNGTTNTTLYASSGISGYVLPFDVHSDGTLSPGPPIFIGGFTAGLALSPDGSSLFVVRFLGEKAAGSSSVAEVALPAPGSTDTPKLLSTDIELQGFGAYNLLALPEGASGIRLWISGFRAGPVQTVARKDATAPFGALGQVLLSKNPEGIKPYGRGVIVALSDSDELAFLEPPPSPDSDPNPLITRDPIHVGKYLPSRLDVQGASPSELVVDPQTKRAFVTLATDDLVSVVNLEGPPSERVINVGQAPSALALVTSAVTKKQLLVVANGKSVYGPQCPKGGCDSVVLPKGPGLHEPDAGIDEGCRGVPDSGTSGIGVCESNDAGLETRPDIAEQIYFDPTQEEGTLALMDGGVFDAPSAETARAAGRVENPVGVYEPPCTEPGFPFSSSDKSSQIKHVVLIVRENKTYDFLLGALGPDGDGHVRNGRPEFEADHIRQRYGWEPITPNLHALAQRYTSLDNFYADSEVSMQGHAWLTSSFVNDYLERIHLEEESSGPFFGFRFDFEPGLPGASPGTDSFFEHLIRYAIPFTIFGEADGIQGSVGDSFVLNHVDLNVKPNDKDSSDLIKVDTVSAALTNGGAPAFTYVLLPRDHTEVITADQLSPVSLIAENDEATGRLIERLSNDPMWTSTVVFLVEDDAQQGYDHVDYHRTICLVIGPFARPDHNSSVHASFPALFHTIEQIFHIPPMNRFDAAAPILWDAFTANGDTAPFASTCAKVPLEVHNPAICESPAQEEQVELDEHPDDEQLVFRSVTGSRYGTSLAPRAAEPGG